MSLIGGTLAMGRAVAEMRFTDECLIERPGAAVLDEDTGMMRPAWQKVWAGRCELAQADTGGSDQDVAGQDVAVTQSVLKLPVTGTEDVHRGDRVTCTASATDPGIAGTTYLVVSRTDASHRTSRRFRIEGLDDSDRLN